MTITISQKSFTLKKAKFMDVYHVNEAQYAYIRKVWDSTPKDANGKATIEVPDDLQDSHVEYKDELVLTTPSPSNPTERSHAYYRQVPVVTNQPLPDNTYWQNTVNSDGSSQMVVGGSNNTISKAIAIFSIVAAGIGLYKTFFGDK